MVALALVLVAVAVVLFTFWFIHLEKIRRNVDKLGGPPALPLIGNVHQLKRSPKEFTKQLYEMIGETYNHLPVFRLMIGAWPLILVCNPEDAEPIMNSTKHLDKSTEYNYLHSWLGTGLLTSTGDKWKVRRKLLTPTFHFKILNDFVAVFNLQSRILQEKLQAKADGKTTIDVFNDITLCALDIICETAMGRSVNAQRNSDSDYVTAVYRASEYTFLRQRTPWYWPNFLFKLLGPGNQYEHSLKILHGFTEKVIHERQAEFSKLHSTNTTMEDLLEGRAEDSGKKQRLAFLDMLLCATSEGERLSFLDIREEVDTFMFEGHDTTAMAANWATHLIGTDPDVQAKVHEELDRVFGDSVRDATMDDLKELKYLECCIKEALRIFPSVPVFGRSLTEDIVLRGVKVDKGSTCLITPWAIHNNKKYFPEPEKFDPDRFLPENSVGRHPYAYLPFSAGSRNCIGQKFAILEEKVMLSTIFRNFSVKSMQTFEELDPMAELILRPGNGIKVILTRRKVRQTAV